MKKIVLVLLVAVMIATPCLAQEIETDGLFSIEGTKWQALIGWQIFPFPLIYFPEMSFGFYDGEVYIEYEEDLRVLRESCYRDMLVFSIFRTSCSSISTNQGTEAPGDQFGILQPIGIGMWIEYYFPSIPLPFLPVITIDLLIKTDDSWSPPEPEVE